MSTCGSHHHTGSTILGKCCDAEGRLYCNYAYLRNYAYLKHTSYSIHALTNLGIEGINITTCQKVRY